MDSSGGVDETGAAHSVVPSATHVAEAGAEADGVEVMASVAPVVSKRSDKTGWGGGGGTHESRDKRTRVTTMEVNGLPMGHARAPEEDDEPDTASLFSYS
jgi:hypothetical protein